MIWSISLLAYHCYLRHNSQAHYTRQRLHILILAIQHLKKLIHPDNRSKNINSARHDVFIFISLVLVYSQNLDQKYLNGVPIAIRVVVRRLIFDGYLRSHIAVRDDASNLKLYMWLKFA